MLAEKYVLVRPLGTGAMGAVWLARNMATSAEVAVKVLLPVRAGAGDALERFRREAYVTAGLNHRGIVRAFDLVELDPAKGSLLLVMERLRGHTLSDRLEHVGRLPVTETLEVVLPILSALAHAHAAGVVHRDLKPENVFLAEEPDGKVMPKLVDFGISKMRRASTSLTRRGALVGTPCYMAPEQARGDEVDARSDVFAIGILLYECLAGGPPFRGESLHEVVRAVLDDPPAPIDGVSSELWSVIARALAKRPEDRYATATDLAAALVAACPGTRAALPPLSVPPGPASLTSVPPAASTTIAAPPPPRPKRRFAAWSAIAVAVLAIAFAARLRVDRAGVATASHAELAANDAKHVVTGREEMREETDTRTQTPTQTPTRTRTRTQTQTRTRKQAPMPTPAPTEAPAAPAPPAQDPVVRDPGF